MSERANKHIHVEAAKRDIVDQITASDRLQFYTVLSQLHSGESSLPDAAFRYFIPPRILELSDDPRQVHIHRVESEKTYASFIISERKKNPVSDEAAFWQFVERFWQHPHLYRTEERRKPATVDNIHATHYYWITSGLLTLNDYVWLRIRLERKSPMNVYVDTHWDREEQHGKGVGHSFYARLQEIMKAVGYRYITGQNTNRNLSFFIDPVKGLGRVPLSKIKKAKRHEFFDNPEKISRADIRKKTIDFLYPEDKGKYVR